LALKVKRKITNLLSIVRRDTSNFRIFVRRKRILFNLNNYFWHSAQILMLIYHLQIIFHLALAITLGKGSIIEQSLMNTNSLQHYPNIVPHFKLVRNKRWHFKLKSLLMAFCRKINIYILQYIVLKTRNHIHNTLFSS